MKNTESFLQKLKDKGLYNDKYDYSLVDYTGHNSLVKVKDVNGFIHNIYVSSLLKGHSIETIANAEDKTAYFINKVKKYKINPFDYSNTVYVDALTEIIVKHDKLGEMTQLPNNHINTLENLQKNDKSKLLSTSDFLENVRLKGKIRKEYDYSEVDFIDYHTKVIIKDENNIRHELLPKKLFTDFDLSIITVKNEDKNRYFEILSKNIHGDKYDYSLVDYIGMNVPVIIICKEHGEFNMTPIDHLYGTGCFECNKLESNKKKYKKFLQKLKDHDMFRNDYDYSSQDSIISNDDTIIIKDEFGFSYETTPHDYIVRKKKLDITNTILFKEYYFKEMLYIKFGHSFDFSYMNFIDENTEVTLIHITKGKMCVKPIDLLSSFDINFKTIDNENYNNDKNTNEKDIMKTKRNKPNFRTKQFIEKAKKVHGEDTYDYSLVDYEESDKHVVIICKEHGKFKQTPNHHLIGGKCQKCKK